jgi:SAM-dependent methyltransferase
VASRKLAHIDIVIPTMWRPEGIIQNISNYIKSSIVSQLVIIDNDPENSKLSEIPKSGKIKIINHGKNIYVNPAWNEGASLCQAEILCIANDDITIDERLFEWITELNLSGHAIDLIGTNLTETDNTSIQKIKTNRGVPLGTQFPSFGACMFMPRKMFRPIPSQLKIWFGDDYLTHQAKNIYLLNTPLIRGGMSATIKSFPPDSDIHKVIKADLQWASNHLLSTKSTNIVSKNSTLTVDLGCGFTPRNPFKADRAIGIDAHCSGDNILNCWVGFEPIPLEESTAEFVTAYDFLEHIPRFAIKDIPFNPFIDTMSEVWRVLKPGGIFFARTPAYPSAAAFQDPTHVNIITDQTVSYFASRPCPDGSFIDQWGPPLGKRYGFKGEFTLIKQWWDTTHLCWKLRAIK